MSISGMPFPPVNPLKRDRQDDISHAAKRPRLDPVNNTNDTNKTDDRLIRENLASACGMATHYHGLAMAQLGPNLPHKANLAKRLEDLFHRLSALGDQEDALKALQKCSVLYTDLAKDDSELSADLARVLESLSDHLSKLGHQEDALAKMQECVALHRSLANGDHKFIVHLARVLERLSGYLADLDRREDALAEVQSCARIYRSLATNDRCPLYKLKLAQMLESRSNLLSQLGRQEDSVAAAQERAAVLRDLAKDGHIARDELSEVLESLSDDLSRLGRQFASLESLQECAALYRGSAMGKPECDVDLARVLESLSDHLVNLGRSEDALAEAQKCAELYREMAQGPSPPCRMKLAFKLKVVRMLGIQSTLLEQLGRQEDSRAAAQERVTVLRDLAKDRLITRDELGEVLRNLSIQLSDLSLRDEALTAAQERVSLNIPIPGEASNQFNLMVASLLSTSSSASSYLALLRYVGDTWGNMSDTASDTTKVQLEGNGRGELACRPPSATLSLMSLTIHDRAHSDPERHSVCTPRCYPISVDMLHGLYEQGHQIYDQLHLICHLQDHISTQCTDVDLQSDFMIFEGAEHHKIHLNPSVHSPHRSPTSLLDLLQSCLTRCDMETEYLYSRPQQKTMLLRILQDVCSATNKLPSLYTLKGPLQEGKITGSGGESLIYRGTWQSKPVAIRRPHCPCDGWDSGTGEKALKSIRREIVSHWQLRHPNVLCLLGIQHEDNVPSMIVPYMENDSAYAYLKKYEFRDGARFSTVISGAASGLEYLHLQCPPVIHGDLHDANIVVDSSGQALLCDFGLSRIRHEITRTYTCIRSGGRDLFIPPELSEQDEPHPNEAGDIYTFAMAMLKLGTGADPFMGPGECRNIREAVRKAQNGLRPRKPPTLGSLHHTAFNNLWLLVEKMWAHDPGKRPNASEVVGVTRELVPATL